MKDHLIKATAANIRAFAAVTTNLTEEARRRHHTSSLATAALGRVMTGAALLAANLKTNEAVTLRIAGGGPLREIIADAYALGGVRGYVKNPQADLPLKNGKWDVGGAVGQGNLFLTRFTNLKQPFTGVSELVSGEIAEDLTHYLTVSEQTPSSVGLGVLIGTDFIVKSAGGFLLQALPGAAEEELTLLEKNIAKLKSVSELVSLGKGAADLLRLVFAGLDFQCHETTELVFACRCSRGRVAEMLVSLGEDELKEMIADGSAEIICHFCGEKYNFNQDELVGLLK